MAKQKWNAGGLKHPISRARGLGAAHDGVNHWKMQRITAIANSILGLWLVYSIIHLAGADYSVIREWLAIPFNAIMMIFFIMSSFYHAVLGAQVIVEDYIHCEWYKITKLVGMKLIYFGLALACIFSILKVAFVSG